MKSKEEKEFYGILSEGESLITERIKDKKIWKKVTEVYNTSVVNFTNSFSSKGKTEQDCWDFASSVIELANEIMINILKDYAMDFDASPYEIPLKKIIKLKKHYFKILFNSRTSDKLIKKLFCSLFHIAYAPSVEKAIEHRELALSVKIVTKKKK